MYFTLEATMYEAKKYLVGIEGNNPQLLTKVQNSEQTRRIYRETDLIAKTSFLCHPVACTPYKYSILP